MTADLMVRVAAKAKRDPATRAVLQVMVGERPQIRAGLRAVATSVNRSRLDGLVEEFVEGSFATDQVRPLLRGAPSRQAVNARRKRGTLLGMTVGTTTWYPKWQFTSSGTRPDLKLLLAALGDVRGDPLVADRVMRLSRQDLDGLSLAEALDDRGHSDEAWRILSSMGDQD